MVDGPHGFDKPTIQEIDQQIVDAVGRTYQVTPAGLSYELTDLWRQRIVLMTEQGIPMPALPTEEAPVREEGAGA